MYSNYSSHCDIGFSYVKGSGDALLLKEKKIFLFQMKIVVPILIE